MTPTELAGRYSLDRGLGRGGMAAVHLARDTVLDRPVAVKLLTREDDPELRARFLREGRLAAGLSHPNVVRVYDTGEDGGRPYIVMEYVEGRSLAELAAGERLDPEDVASLGRQACAGLAHAHEAGIVHRDVKPQNLLLRHDGQLKVADFGIARGATGATITEVGTLLGTAGYMAPELVAGEPATPASDLYALGAVLYELLTGRPPREVATLSDLDFARPVVPASELVPAAPAALTDAIGRCLDADPGRRPPSAAELALELEGTVEPATVSVDAPTRMQHSPPAHRPSRRVPGRLAWPLLAGVAAAVLAAGAVTALGDGGGTPQQVEPVPAAPSPAEEARNLSSWLRANAEP